MTLFVLGGFPRRWRVVSSISDFYLLDASSSFPAVTTKILTLSNFALGVGVGDEDHAQWKATGPATW